MVAQMLTKKAVLKIYWNSQENIFAEVFFFNEVAIFYRAPANGSFRTWPTVFDTNDMHLFKIMRKLPYKTSYLPLLSPECNVMECPNLLPEEPSNFHTVSPISRLNALAYATSTPNIENSIMCYVQILCNILFQVPITLKAEPIKFN